MVPAEPGGNQEDESSTPSRKPSQELREDSDTRGGSLWSDRLRPCASARGRAGGERGEMH